MTTVPPELTLALGETDEALARLDAALADLGDGALHLASAAGGWTAAQIVRHVNVSVLLWVAALGRVAADLELSFLFREEVGHDALGYPPPTVELARGQLASAHRTLSTVLPGVAAEVLERQLTIPDLGTRTVQAWTPPILGHAAGHAAQAMDVLRERGALA